MATKLWQPQITHARFVVGAFSSEQMATLGNILSDAIKARIQSAMNVYDLPAKPLSDKVKVRRGRDFADYSEVNFNAPRGYATQKRKKGRNPVRDWTNSGRTMQALRMLAASENRAVIGFNNPVAGRIAHWNNLKERAFGVSPSNRQVLMAAMRATMRQSKVVTVSRELAAYRALPVMAMPAITGVTGSGTTITAFGGRAA
jgi:hypothetical protein